ncbi:MAG: hypothetical protein RLZZ592_1834 [Pseudomonadota bacterium]|jgi:PAS domain S-box-containing protein
MKPDYIHPPKEMRALVELMPDAAVLVGSQDGRVQAFNGAASRLFGAMLEVGRPMQTLLGAEHHAQLAQLLDAPGSGPARRLPVRLETGQPTGLAPRALLRIGPVQQIGTQAPLRLWQLEALGQAERHDPLHLRIFDAMPSAMLVLDHEARLLVGNAAALRLLALDPLALRGRRLDQLGWRALDATGTPRPLETRRLRARRATTTRLHLVDPHGRERWLDVSVTPIELMPGLARTGHACAVVEVTDQVHAERELAQLHAGLEQRVKARTAELESQHQEMERFTYSVSHDLKAPLRGLDGYSQLLLTEKRDQLDEEGRLFVDQIRRAARQMGQLIEDLLTYSRVERLRPVLGAVALEEAIGAALDEARDPLQRIDASVSLDLRHLSITGERRGLLLVMRNLIDNAIKFRHPDRPLRLDIAACQRPDRGITLTITDNGIGFDMRYHDRIFEIFQRLHRLEDHPGTGIGLAIVRKAMERMRGQVHARSAPGCGATFLLEFTPPASSTGGAET